MLKKVEAYIKQYHMIEEGDRIVLGVSGGADSISLFFVMLELCKKYNIEMVVVHVNHGIRGEEAAADERYVISLCEQHGILFECIHADVRGLAKSERMSEEEAGRNVRYEAFKNVAERYACNKIAVAHNLNDVSETVLLNLFRGTGMKGLAGIEPVRGNLIRPLLSVRRSEIEDYLKKRGIPYQQDATNFEEDYTRNKIRLNIIPYAEKEINERASEHIANSAGILSEAGAFIDSEAEKLYKRTVSDSEGGCEIDITPFEQAPAILKKEVIRKVLFRVAGKQKDIEMTHVEMVQELFVRGAGKKADLPYGMEAVNQYQKVVVKKKEEMRDEAIREMQVAIPGVTIIPESGMRITCELINMDENNRAELEKLILNKKNNYTKWFDYDKIKNAVLARYRKTGDYFEYNDKSNRKKLKDYFIDQKVPAQERDRILLLADGNHIMWIIGFRISEHYKINSRTKRILKVKVNGGNEHDGQN